jgi:hypothetical protein
MDIIKEFCGFFECVCIGFNGDEFDVLVKMFGFVIGGYLDMIVLSGELQIVVD